jgi:hydrogenase maturation factor
MDGLKVACVYSLPSFSLGFCGPQDKKSQKTLLDFASGKSIPEKKVRGIFEKFEAAYHYYKLIAEKNKITDPLNERVVRAFWVGNALLEKVNEDDLRNLILIDFCQPGLLTKAQAEKKAASIPKEAVPHHSFHVLVLGAITGRIELKDSMLDLCRIGWGRVAEIKSKKSKVKTLRVKYRPLVLSKNISLGEGVEKEINWNQNIVPKVIVGDWVSFHWASACEVLDKESVNNLELYTRNTIRAINEQSK